MSEKTEISLAIPVSEWPEFDRMGVMVHRMVAERPHLPLTPTEVAEED